MICYAPFFLDKEQRLDLYWQMYFCAEGLSDMTPAKMKAYNDVSIKELPYGICYLLRLLDESGYDRRLVNMPEFNRMDRTVKSDCGYWWPRADWTVRKRIILGIIAHLAEEIRIEREGLIASDLASMMSTDMRVRPVIRSVGGKSKRK